MLKNEIDVLVIAHNISIAFDWLKTNDQEKYLRRLREIERDACSQAQAERWKETN